MTVADTLDFLVGTWTVERLIDDHRSGIRGRFDGTAVLLPEEGAEPVTRASYQEAGELRFGEHTGPASRRLTYVRSGGAVLLYFADGRPYTDLDLRSGTWETEHPCVADLYAVRTEVCAPDELRERWRVRGPDKDYDAVTVLRRQPARPAT